MPLLVRSMRKLPMEFRILPLSIGLPGSPSWSSCNVLDYHKGTRQPGTTSSYSMNHLASRFLSLPCFCGCTLGSSLLYSYKDWRKTSRFRFCLSDNALYLFVTGVASPPC